MTSEADECLNTGFIGPLKQRKSKTQEPSGFITELPIFYGRICGLWIMNARVKTTETQAPKPHTHQPVILWDFKLCEKTGSGADMNNEQR